MAAPWSTAAQTAAYGHELGGGQSLVVPADSPTTRRELARDVSRLAMDLAIPSTADHMVASCIDLEIYPCNFHGLP